MTQTVSVITTCYNTEPFIRDCLDSILASSHQDLELVVVDDGSDDFSGEIAMQYALRDSRVRAVATPHRGRRAALETAHDAASGDVQCWVDSDDILHPEAIQTCLGALDAEHRLVYTHRRVLSEDGLTSVPDHRNGTGYSPLQILVNNMISHFRIWTTDLFEESGGVGEFEAAIDWDMNLRMTECTEPTCVPYRLYDYRIRRGRMTGTPLQETEGMKAVGAALKRRDMDYNLEVRDGAWFLRKSA